MEAREASFPVGPGHLPLAWRHERDPAGRTGPRGPRNGITVAAESLRCSLSAGYWISNDCSPTGIVTLIVPNMPWPGPPWTSQK